MRWVTGAVACALIVGFIATLTKADNVVFLGRDHESIRLARVAGTDAATSLVSWLAHPKNGLAAVPTVGAVLLAIACLSLAFRTGDARRRRAVVVLFGAVCVTLAAAWIRLRDWALVDIVLLGVAAATAAEFGAVAKRVSRWAAVVGVGLVLAIGGWLFLPKGGGRAEPTLDAAEAEQLIERDLAQWLARHSPSQRAVVFAPPHQTLTLVYYGGFRGLGTYAAENRAGFGVSIRLAGASSMEAVQAIVEAHRVRYIVIPSWDPFFENFARLYLAPNLANRGSLLVQELRRLNLPPWLRPVAYEMPPIGGFEKQWVLVFEVVDEQSPVVAASRLADYLVEMGDLDRARAVAQTLHRFPGNIGALAALAQVQLASRETEAATASAQNLATLIGESGGRNIPVDRRVAVAITLARAQLEQPARRQIERCLAELDEAAVRSLSTGALYNFLVLQRAFELPWPNPPVGQIALELLPPHLRQQL
jgi:hypothetical protein